LTGEEGLELRAQVRYGENAYNFVPSVYAGLVLTLA